MKHDLFRCRPHQSALASALALVLCGSMAGTARAHTAPSTTQLEDDGRHFLALSYHDIRRQLPPGGDPRDPYALDLDTLVSHFAWLREHGYTPVSVDDLLAARDGQRPLPARAVLLTFDDGLRSVHELVFPLLRLFDYPAVVAVTTSWLEAPVSGEATDNIDYNGIPLPRHNFLTWSQLREMADSGLIEVALHSHDLHHGVLANRAGNLQPAAVTRIFDPSTGSYESEADFRRRLVDDLVRGREVLRQQLGTTPRVHAWPFGASNAIAEEAAAEAGFVVTLDLHPGWHSVSDLFGVHRFSPENGLPLQNLVWFLRHPHATSPERYLTLDLDDLDVPGLGPDQLAAREAKLGDLLDFLEGYDLNRLHLRITDPQVRDPRRDLLNRTVWQLRQRLGIATALYLRLDPATAAERGEALAAAVDDYAATSALTGLVLDFASDAVPAETARLSGRIRHRLRRHHKRAELLCRVEVQATAGAAPNAVPTAASWPEDLRRRLDGLPEACDQVLVHAGPEQLTPAALDQLARLLHEAVPAPHLDDLRRLPWVELPAPARAACGSTGTPTATAPELYQALRQLQRQRVLNLGIEPCPWPTAAEALRELRPAWSLTRFPYRRKAHPPVRRLHHDHP